MRPFLIPFSVWLLALQLPFPATAINTMAGVGEFLSAAAALAAFTVAVYRLGVWRQEMHNTRDNLSAELARQREEMNERLARIEQTVAGSREPGGQRTETGRRKTEAARATGGES